MILKLALREIKNSPKHWAFYVINLVVGLIGFTCIFVFRGSVSNSLEQRSTQLLSSDLAISGRRQLGPEEASQVTDFLKLKITDQAKMIELYSMGKSPLSGKSRLVFIKAIENIYPLRGALVLKEAGLVDKNKVAQINSKPIVWVSPEVAHQFKVQQGDKLKLGRINFMVGGIIEADSTSSMRGFSLAPKVYIGQKHLDKTGLIGYGTVAWYTRFYNLMENQDPTLITEKLQSLITDPAIKVRNPKNSGQRVGRVIGYLSDFLGLIAIVALLMSAVGISYLFQSYLLGRVKHIGILKSLGVSNKQILLSFMLCIVFIGLVASVISLGVTHLLMPIAETYLQTWFRGEFYSGISVEMVAAVLILAIGMNLITCIPLLSFLFREKTVDLLNESLKTKGSFKNYLPAVLFLWGMGIWQSHSFLIGTVFFASLMLVFALVLLLFPIIFKKLSQWLRNKKLSYPGGLSAGIAVRVLVRERLSSLLLILSLSIGVTLITVIGQLDKSLRAELTGPSTKKPSLFLFDIQEEQAAELRQFANDNDIPLGVTSPMVRARLIKKNGKIVKREEREEGFTTREQEQSRRFNNRGVNLSYGSSLNSSEELVEGGGFSGKFSGEGLAEVSLEKRYAQRLEVGVGDTLTYDVLGVEVQARVINLRKVNWTSFLPNFFILFQPGVLELAPKTFISTVDKLSFERQLEVQDLLVESFPNISILNVSEVISKILLLFKAMAWAVSIMSLCCIIVGVFVVFSIVQSQVLGKQHELALQKALGLGEKMILKSLFIEFFGLALISQILGTVVGTLVAYGVSQIFLDGIFLYNWEFFLVLNISLSILVAMTIGLNFKDTFGKSVNTLLLD